METSTSLSIPETEIRLRVTALQAMMIEHGLSAIVCFGANRDYAPADLWYLARWSTIDEELSFVFVPASGETTLITDAPWDVDRAGEEAVADSIVFDPEPGDTIAGLIRLQCRAGDRVGVSGMRSMPARILDTLRAGAVNIEDATWLTEEQRMVKSDLELQLMEEAACISDLGMAAGMDAALEGVREFEVVAEAEYAIAKAGGERSFMTVMGSGPRTALMTFLPSERRLSNGDLVILDCGARISGYHGDMCRTKVVGEPTGEQRRMLTAVRDALEAGIDAAHPGGRVRDIHDAARSSVAQAGFGDSWWGDYMPHGAGAGQHEAPIGLADGDVGLRPGMVLCVEPGVGIPGVGGVILEQMIRITETGVLVMNSLPLDLWDP